MCNLGKAVEFAGEVKGAEKTMIQNIKNLMKNLKLSAEQAMDALGIPKIDKEKYAAKL